MDYDSATHETRTNAEHKETAADFRVTNESHANLVAALNRAWGDCDPGPTKWKQAPEGHMVYFVGGETGPVKIGWTQQPIKARLVCIQNGSPVKLHVLATVRAFRNLERLYHRRFCACRLHGEWFERTPEIEAEIERLTDAP